jgi:hypothetical protein
MDLSDGKEELQTQLTKLQGLAHEQRDELTELREQLKYCVCVGWCLMLGWFLVFGGLCLFDS